MRALTFFSFVQQCWATLVHTVRFLSGKDSVYTVWFLSSKIIRWKLGHACQKKVAFCRQGFSPSIQAGFPDLQFPISCPALLVFAHSLRRGLFHPRWYKGIWFCAMNQRDHRCLFRAVVKSVKRQNPFCNTGSLCIGRRASMIRLPLAHLNMARLNCCDVHPS